MILRTCAVGPAQGRGGLTQPAGGRDGGRDGSEMNLGSKVELV